MSENEQLSVTTDDMAGAAFFLMTALLAQLTIKGLLTSKEANFVAASAASMSRGRGQETAAKLIENVMPTAKDVNLSVAAMEQGIQILRKPS